VTPLNFKPLFDRIVVKMVMGKTPAGIDLPVTLPTHMAVVIAAGDGSRYQDGTLCPVKVKPGDKVLLERGVGVPVEINFKEYHLIREGDIVGVFEEAALSLCQALPK
jgi:chaperonin GroES